MDFKKVSGFLGQQLKALGEMKDLIAHEKKNPGHKVSADDVKAFEDYVATMEKASRAGKALADFYAAGSAKPPEPEKVEEAAPSEADLEAEKARQKAEKAAAKKAKEKADAEAEAAAEVAKAAEDDGLDFLD